MFVHDRKTYMSELSEDFQYLIEKMGQPQTYGRPDASYINSLRQKFPHTLVDFWETHGWCSMAAGKLWMPNPADFDDLMDVVFTDDSQINHSKCHVIAYSAFGKCWIWSEQLQDISIRLTRGWVYSSAMVDGELSDYPDNNVTSFSTGKEDKYDQLDSDGKKLYARSRRKYGELEPGECYGFFPALALGGSGNLEDIKRVNALEHFALLAQIAPLTLIKFEGTSMVPVRTIG